MDCGSDEKCIADLTLEANASVKRWVEVALKENEMEILVAEIVPRYRPQIDAFIRGF